MNNEIDLYYSATPNGHKVLLALEELAIPYNIRFIDIEKGDQFSAEFDRISPNNRIPAIVDNTPLDHSNPISVFESAAILVYLAEKHQKFLDTSIRGRTETMQWLFWQMAGLGPMAGQAHHFIHYAPVYIEYGIKRYVAECARLYGVLNKRLTNREYLVKDYSIADMACWGWVMRHHRHNQNLDDFPNIKRWYNSIEARPAAQNTRKIARKYSGVSSDVSDETREVLFKGSSQI